MCLRNIMARWPGSTHSFVLTNSSVVRTTMPMYTNLHIKWGRRRGAELCSIAPAHARACALNSTLIWDVQRICKENLCESVLTQGWYIQIDLCVGFLRPQCFSKKSTQVFVHKAPGEYTEHVFGKGNKSVGSFGAAQILEIVTVFDHQSKRNRDASYFILEWFHTSGLLSVTVSSEAVLCFQVFFVVDINNLRVSLLHVCVGP